MLEYILVYMNTHDFLYNSNLFASSFLCLDLQYLECEADNKPSQLVDLLIKNKSKKVIV